MLVRLFHALWSNHNNDGFSYKLSKDFYRRTFFGRGNNFFVTCTALSNHLYLQIYVKPILFFKKKHQTSYHNESLCFTCKIVTFFTHAFRCMTENFSSMFWLMWWLHIGSRLGWTCNWQTSHCSIIHCLKNIFLTR